VVLAEGEGRAWRLGALVALDSSAGVQEVQRGGGWPHVPTGIYPSACFVECRSSHQCGQWIEQGGSRMSDKRAQGFSFFSKLSIADFNSMLEKNS
jgi:hypothetical protein